MSIAVSSSRHSVAHTRVATSTMAAGDEDEMEGPWLLNNAPSWLMRYFVGKFAPNNKLGLPMHWSDGKPLDDAVSKVCVARLFAGERGATRCKGALREPPGRPSCTHTRAHVHPTAKQLLSPHCDITCYAAPHAGSRDRDGRRRRRGGGGRGRSSGG